ncbi:MAG TPA: hypothetical protein VLD63_13795 [Anaerolineales bacterium]|nr:hypothetical protein [Anaerolineales bacterium]
MQRKLLILGGALLALAALLAACGQGAATTAPAVTEEPAAQPTLEVPFEAEWSGSAHADASAEPFRHWDEEDPAAIPAACAKCHSTYGYRDFLGLDGTAYGSVENDAQIGSVITCVACHNTATMAMDSVVMPSGLTITGLGREARCMQCHQGRESTVSVNAAIEAAGVGDDTVSEDLGFKNIHYFAAAATKYGTLAKGGYEYAGRTYDANTSHVAQFDTCIECHNVHTLEVKVDQCRECHTNVNTVEDLKNVRMNGSLVDYDGDGNTEEGIYYEIAGIREKLLQAIQAYGDSVAGGPIGYDAATYPYFFGDANSNGTVDEGEGAYAFWTPRLLRAAYNYQVSIKDPGMFAHGGKYIIELLFDSLADVNTELASPVSMDGMHRTDAGHFAGSEEAFRHWDEEGEVPGTCSRCHSAGGLAVFLKEGVTVSQPLSNGFTCSTCHDSVSEFTRRQVTNVTMPSGATVTFSSETDAEGNLIPVDANLCLVCHQGRESTVSMNRAIGSVADDVVIGDTNGNGVIDEGERAASFRNPHYFAAGATLFGGDAHGAYEYTGQSYRGRNLHVQNLNTCVGCHDTHSLQVKVATCSGCHPSATDVETLRTIRMDSSKDIDFDGDGNVTEGIGEEVATMEEALYAAIQAYGADHNAAILYDGARYPYFFSDANANGTIDEGEGNYAAWTPRLLRAAYNYQWVQKDPGAFAHNGKYILQVLYDSMKDLGGNVSGMTRP